jgi:hypothetical protein
LVDDKEDSLDVNLKQDVCLGKDAWEHSTKTINLTDPKVVSFATHALNPGDKAAHYAKATRQHGQRDVRQDGTGRSGTGARETG